MRAFLSVVAGLNYILCGNNKNTMIDLHCPPILLLPHDSSQVNSKPAHLNCFLVFHPSRDNSPSDHYPGPPHGHIYCSAMTLIMARDPTHNREKKLNGSQSILHFIILHSADLPQVHLALRNSARRQVARAHSAPKIWDLQLFSMK